MGHNAEQFLNSFNRIEKWLKEQLNNPSGMGFSEMTRRMAKKKQSQVAPLENDLLQLAQLRNAIVHERIAKDFVIAEPNQWAVERILAIEEQLIAPEKVLPRFAKHVTGFEKGIALEEILKIVAKKQYSQFPIYHSGHFQGLITVRGLGIWMAVESMNNGGNIHLEGKTAGDLLSENYKQGNYQFVDKDTNVYQVEEMFETRGRLEAVLITKDGDPNGNLLGIIRPRDLYEPS